MTPEDERRQTERRKPMVVLTVEDAKQLMKEQRYTGIFIGHAHEGVIKKIELPNQRGWS